MSNSQKNRNRIQLPTFGAELFTYLKDVNDHESFTASMRIKDILSENIKKEVSSWFITGAIPELDRTLLRKITNSLLSAGTVGEKRTKDAMGEIRFSSGNLNKPITSIEAASYLRNWSRDFRSAKGFLDHQYKCINSFLRIQKTTNDESVRNMLRLEINDHNDFVKWQSELENYWDTKQLVKVNLRTSYLNIFRVFMGTFDANLENGMYHSFLDQNWQNYLEPIFLNVPIPNHSFNLQKDEEPLVLNKYSDSKPFDIDIKIAGGEIFYHISCNRLSEFQASELRLKIALGISQQSKFNAINFSVSLVPSDVPVILIRTDSPANEEDLTSIVRFLESMLDRMKVPG